MEYDRRKRSETKHFFCWNPKTTMIRALLHYFDSNLMVENGPHVNESITHFPHRPHHSSLRYRNNREEWKMEDGAKKIQSPREILLHSIIRYTLFHISDKTSRKEKYITCTGHWHAWYTHMCVIHSTLNASECECVFKCVRCSCIIKIYWVW